MIEQLYPLGNKLELFGRKQHDGWTVFGSEMPDRTIESPDISHSSLDGVVSAELADDEILL